MHFYQPRYIFNSWNVVSGTPTSSRCYIFNIRNFYSNRFSNGNTEDLFVSFPIINASGGGVIQLLLTNAGDVTTSLGSLTQNSSITMTSLNLSATGSGMSPISYSCMMQVLPTGIKFKFNRRTFGNSYCHQRATGASVTFTATDSNGGTEDLIVSFPMINSSGGGSVTWTTLDTDFPSTLIENNPITSVTLNASGSGAINYTYTGSLPPGLILTANVLSGTPTTQSVTSTTITFTATDTASNTEDLIVTLPQVDASGGGISNPSWVTQPSFNASYTTSDNFSISASANSSPPANGVNYSATGLPMGVTIDSNSGLISGITTMTGAYNVTVTAQDAIDATYQVSTASLSFTVTEGGGAETVDFTTAETLPSANAGQNINETVVATGSQGSMPAYSFISVTNTGNINGLGGTTITITGNQISGIAPRLLNAATYSFEFQASIQAGTITNNRTFTLLISEDATCVSPTNNICT